LRHPVSLGRHQPQARGDRQRSRLEPRSVPGIRGERRRSVQRRPTRLSPTPGAADQGVKVRGRFILLGLLAAAAVGCLIWPALTPGGRPARASAANGDGVKAGRALYVRYCATCHGETGRGDGSSAASFATMPADLTDGRLMDGLPDVFRFKVVMHGGPAEVTAPSLPPTTVLTC